MERGRSVKGFGYEAWSARSSSWPGDAPSLSSPVGAVVTGPAGPVAGIVRSMQQILDAIQSGASGEDIANLPIPESYRAAYVRRDEADMFEGVASEDKDPRKSLHVGEVATPELAPDEAYVAVMASAINFNTVWTSIFEPLSTFGFLDRLGRESEWGARHALDQHIVGSDGSGVVLQVGSAVRNWKPGDRVTIHCNHLDDQDPTAHDDSMLAANQRIWGFETNFGGMADLTVVKANQLMPKPAHLSWEEAACNALCNSTSYRMIVSKHAGDMKQGEAVLIWGATGGIGGYAVQYVLNGGGVPVGVVSSPERADLLRDMGCEHVIDRREAGYKFWADEHTQDEKEWRRLGKDIRGLIGRDVDMVFEHPGRSTFGASVFAAARGGRIVTCAATSGYMIEYDNRHLWMKLKRIISSHFANYQEAWAANQLIAEGRIQPILSQVHPLEEAGAAALSVHRNEVEGKLGVLCLAPEEGQGIDDPEKRQQVGEDKITLFRRMA
jgi:crotonyl-CoA reductase